LGRPKIATKPDLKVIISPLLFSLKQQKIGSLPRFSNL